jgi:hypothetical protein
MSSAKGYSPLRRWIREERARDWPEEQQKQERERQFGTLGFAWDEHEGLWYRVNRAGEKLDVYYTGVCRWEESPR